MKQGRLDEAEEWLRKSLAIAPWERESNYQLAKTSGIPITVPVSLSAKPKRVKVVVYQYAADRIGSVIVKVQ